MLSDEEKEKALTETEIRFRADLIILNSEFPTHRKTEAMEELLEIYNKQSKEIEELKKYKKYYEEMEEVNKKFITVDKIKEKIKELEKQDREDRVSHNYLVIPVLQSLLEKE